MITLKSAKFKSLPPLSLSINHSQRWAILGPDRAKLLDVLAGKLTPEDASSRKYSWGKEFWPTKVIQQIEFGQGAQSQAPYLAARFESYRDEFDLSVEQSLGGPSESVSKVLKTLALADLAERWVVGLSNGQSRRLQIASALLKDPKLLIVNDPFLGVDPENRTLLDSVLGGLRTPVILGLCSSQPIPDWITHVAIVDENGIRSGQKKDFNLNYGAEHTQCRSDTKLGPVVFEAPDLSVFIKGQPIFEHLDLKIRKGERVHLQGPNGSGKSTLLAVITADHPQGWSENITMFGQQREVGKDSYMSINKHIGMSASEIHAIFPRHLKASEAIGTGFRGDFTRCRDLSSEQQEKVSRWLKRIGVANERFADLNKQDQKLVLLARALVKDPELLLLDEAFSTFDDNTLSLAFAVLDEYKGSVIVIGHNAREIPPCDTIIDISQNQ